MAIGFGIIGCGMISKFHARAIADVRGAKLVACFNRTLPAAERLAAEFGGSAHDDLERFLATPGLDVVTIATPSGAHLEPALAAAAAGKHVIVEKPLEITLKRCDAMIDACRRAGVLLATIFPSRFHRAARLLKEAVEQERFGRLTLGDAYVKWYRSQQYYDSGAWRGTWDLDGGGALMNQAIHSVDLLTWIMGPVTEIAAFTGTLAHERIEVEDTAVATLRFANGALGTIEATTAAFPGSLKRIEIHGDGGSAVLQEEDLTLWEFARPRASDRKIREAMAGRTTTGGGAADPKAIGHHGHAALFKEVVGAIRGGNPLTCDGNEGRRAVEIILGLYKAAETGRRVSFPLTKDPVLAARRRSRETS
ncbi:MAG TPA: oxidoreductase [Planctomycetaceae bacterium]|nr:oxidoreductase [Planctomycetaceae bacterium]HRF00907.1 Gfo/Idh/MocA family oxidoreductase [Pirellulaceae bacterium]